MVVTVIFIDNELAAFISCPEACKKLVEGLKARLPKHSKVEAIERERCSDVF